MPWLLKAETVSFRCMRISLVSFRQHRNDQWLRASHICLGGSWSAQEPSYPYNIKICSVHKHTHTHGVQSQQFLLQDLPYHSFPEIGHVFLFKKEKKKKKRMKRHLNAHTQVWPITYSELYANDVHLCECDWSVFGDVFSIFACEHSAVTSIHLLRDLLSIQGNKKNLSDDPGVFWVFFCFLNQFKTIQAQNNVYVEKLTLGLLLFRVHSEVSKFCPFLSSLSCFRYFLKYRGRVKTLLTMSRHA